MKKDQAEQLTLKALVTSVDLPGVTKYVSGDERRQQSSPSHGRHSVEVHSPSPPPQQHSVRRGGTSNIPELDGNFHEATTSVATAACAEVQGASSHIPESPGRNSNNLNRNYSNIRLDERTQSMEDNAQMSPSTVMSPSTPVTSTIVNYTHCVINTGPCQVGNDASMKITNTDATDEAAQEVEDVEYERRDADRNEIDEERETERQKLSGSSMPDSGSQSEPASEKEFDGNFCEATTSVAPAACAEVQGASSHIPESPGRGSNNVNKNYSNVRSDERTLSMEDNALMSPSTPGTVTTVNYPYHVISTGPCEVSSDTSMKRNNNTAATDEATQGIKEVECERGDANRDETDEERETERQKLGFSMPSSGSQSDPVKGNETKTGFGFALSQAIKESSQPFEAAKSTAKDDCTNQPDKQNIFLEKKRDDMNNNKSRLGFRSPVSQPSTNTTTLQQDNFSASGTNRDSFAEDVTKERNVEVQAEGEINVQNPKICDSTLPSFMPSSELNLQEPIAAPPQPAVPFPPRPQVQQPPVSSIQSFSTTAEGSTFELPSDMSGVNDFDSSHYSSQNSNLAATGSTVDRPSDVSGINDSSHYSSENSNSSFEFSNNLSGLNSSIQRDASATNDLSVDSSPDNTHAVDTPERNITARGNEENRQGDVNTQQDEVNQAPNPTISWFGAAWNFAKDLYHNDYFT